MTQTEARKRAKVKQGNGLPVIAGAVPLASWGGREKEWGLYLVTGLKPITLELLER